MDMYTYNYPDQGWVPVKKGDIEVLPKRRLACSFHCIHSKGSRYLFLFGGYDGDNVLNDLWIYDFKRGTWKDNSKSVAGKKPTPRSNFSSGIWRRDKVVIFGGLGLYHRDVYNDTFIYNHSTNTMLEVETIGKVPKLRSSGMVIHHDEVILFGGYSYPERHAISRIFKLNFRNNTWSEIIVQSLSSPRPRMFCNMVLMGGGKRTNDHLDRYFFYKHQISENSRKRKRRSQARLTLTKKKSPNKSPKNQKVVQSIRFFEEEESEEEENEEQEEEEEEYDPYFYIFGGRDETMKERFDEVWRFNLYTHHWERVLTENTPVGRSGSAFCKIGKDFYIHGGSREANEDRVESNKMSSLWRLRISESQLIVSLKRMVRTESIPFSDVQIFCRD